MRPRDPMVAELAAAEISAAVGYSVTPADFGWRGEGTTHDLGLVVADSPAQTLSSLTGVAARDLRRGDSSPYGTGFVASAFAEPALASLAGIIPRIEAAAPSVQPRPGRAGYSSGPVTSAAVVRDVVASFRKLDARFGGGEIRSQVVAFAHERLRAAAGGPANAELFSALGELAQFSGWLAQECGHPALGQRYYIQALSLAEHAGDAMMAGRVLSTMSDQAALLGHRRQSLALASAALDRAGRAAAPLVAAMLHDKHAWALARVGDEAGCTEALFAMEQAASRAVPGDGPAWAGHYNAGDVAECQGRCFRLLGRPLQAEQRLVEGRTLQKASRVRTRCYAEADLALSYLQRQAPDLEGALEAANAAVGLASGLSSTRIAGKLRELDQAFAGHRTIAAQRWRRTTAPLLSSPRK
ncbi:transcriptional regulator [Frankia nepalensis]|nr:transcriptional regulator [Frankia nepalensis]